MNSSSDQPLNRFCSLKIVHWLVIVNYCSSYFVHALPVVLEVSVALSCWLCTSYMNSRKKDAKKSGKKGGKNAEKEADIKAMSVANSNLWQARLEVVEQSRIEHRCFHFIGIFLILDLIFVY